MFKLLGALLSIYVLYAIAAGKVFAKSGPWARVVVRDERPHYFWSVIVIYAALGIALIAWF